MGTLRRWGPVAIMWLIFAAAMTLLRSRGMSYFDANEFATHIRGGGIAHAPGYSLYILLGKGFNTFLADPFAAQFAVNLLASLVALAALHHTLTKDGSELSWRVSLVVCAAFLSGYHFKLYTVLPEVFMLNLALFALLILCLDEWHDAGRDRCAFFVALLCGLGVCHQHTLALMAPAVLVVLLLRGRAPRRLRSALMMLAGLGFGLLPLLWLYLAAHAQAPYSYYEIRGFGDQMFVILRQGYGSLQLSASAPGSHLWTRFFFTLTMMLLNLNFIGLLLLIALVLGLVESAALRRALFPVPTWLWLALSGLAMFCILFLPLAQMSLDAAADRQIFARFVSIPSFLLLYVAAWVMRALAAHRDGKTWLAIALALVLISNFHRRHNIDFRNTDLIGKHVAEAFATAARVVNPADGPALPEGYLPCIFFIKSDALYFGARYYNEFLAPRRCYLFNDVSLSGVFRSRAEEEMVAGQLGADYLTALHNGFFRVDQDLVQQTLQELRAKGFRLFYLYVRDAPLDENTGLQATPVGNVLEWIDADAKQQMDDLVAEDQRFLDMIEAYLDRLDRHPPSTLIIDEAVSNGVFSNLPMYASLLRKAKERYRTLLERHERLSQRVERVMGYKIPL